MDAQDNSHIMPSGAPTRRRVAPWLLALVVLSAIVFGPLGLPSYAAGFLKSYLLQILFLWPVLIGWLVLFSMVCRRFAQGLRARRQALALWLGTDLGIVLAFTLGMIGRTPCPIGFGHGLIHRLEIRTNIGAIQAWVEAVDPEACIPAPHSGGRSRYLAIEECPQVLQRQDGMVGLELDARGRPCVRLSWLEGKAGTWGLIIGHKDMRTPPSDWDMCGEQRIELRPGVYFWYQEA